MKKESYTRKEALEIIRKVHPSVVGIYKARDGYWQGITLIDKSFKFRLVNMEYITHHSQQIDMNIRYKGSRRDSLYPGYLKEKAKEMFCWSSDDPKIERVVDYYGDGKDKIVVRNITKSLSKDQFHRLYNFVMKKFDEFEKGENDQVKR